MKKNKKETLKSKVKRDYLETSETQGKSEWRFPGFLFWFFSSYIPDNGAEEAKFQQTQTKKKKVPIKSCSLEPKD